MAVTFEPGVTFTRLPNGLRVVSHALPALRSVSVGLWVGAGSRHESAEKNGVSHFLEHMAFKSTLRRSARDMAEAIESVGGELNAATGQETTAYAARVLQPDLGLALGLIAEMLTEPKFDPEEVERERAVILQEIAGVADQPEELLFEAAESTAYPDQALGRPILGDEDTVSALSAADLKAHLAAYYAPSAMVVAAAGAVDHEALVRHAEALFGRFDGGSGPAHAPARFVGGATALDEAFEQHHLLAAFEGPSYASDDYYRAQALSGILGGGASSRLFQKIREDRGLCYAIDSFTASHADTGLFGVHTAAASENAPELTELLADEFRALASDGPTDQELTRAKAQMRAGALMGLESPAACADIAARQTLAFGAPLAAGAVEARIEEINRAALRDCAQRIIGSGRLVWSEVGPGASGQGSDKLRTRIKAG